MNDRASEIGRSDTMHDVAGGPPLHVVVLSTFPLSAAATRFRVGQFLPHLSRYGMQVTLLPFLNDAAYGDLYNRKRVVKTAFRLIASLARRFIQLPRILRADVVMLQREAMLVGPPWIEWLASRVARIPLVLDLDDATWIPVRSPVYGRIATLLKSPSKNERLIRWATIATCGNEMIANHVRGNGVKAVIVPSIVDPSVFVPRTDSAPEVPVVGWIGTHSTWKYFEPLLPVLEEVARSVPFRLRIVGSGCSSITVRGVEVDLLPWHLDREVHDFQTLDVGLYPLTDDAWTAGKSGLKLMQYFAVGVASVASPVGIVNQLGVDGVTHLLASTPDQWRVAIERLLRNVAERKAMALAARRYAVEHSSVELFAARIAGVLREAAGAHLSTKTADMRHAR